VRFTKDGLPIGLQIVGRRFADTLVLRASAAFGARDPGASTGLPSADARPERGSLALALRAFRPQFLPRGSFMKLATVLGLCLTVLVALVAAGVSAQTTLSSDAISTTTSNPDGTTTTTLTATPTPSASPATTGTPVVLNVVEITRLVPAGPTAVTAFTVPAGQTLIVTDVLVTNTGLAATCGAAINRAGGAAAAPVTTPTGAAPATTGAATAATPLGTITQSDSSITGPLCVAPRTTTPLPLTTGIEFGPGQMVQLINVPDATTAAGTAAAAATAGAVASICAACSSPAESPSRLLDIDAGSVAADAARVSLADLLVALATFGLVAAAAFTLLDEGQRAWAFGAARAEAQQNGRAALARLAGEIRNAGRGGHGFAAVAVAEPAEIVLQQDLDGDGIIFANGERVRWRLAGAILRRDAGGGAQPIVNGVRALTLTYFDAAGAPTTTPAAVRAVEIVLVTRPDSSVPGAAASTASIVLTTGVRLRNR